MAGLSCFGRFPIAISGCAAAEAGVVVKGGIENQFAE
jgi:hypothetical protein